MGATMQRRKGFVEISGQIPSWKIVLNTSAEAANRIKDRLPQRSLGGCWFRLLPLYCQREAAPGPQTGTSGQSEVRILLSNSRFDFGSSRYIATVTIETAAYAGSILKVCAVHSES
ncbi:hypothetical protein RHODOSMS8_01217 [Rhodobiaceae bacterium]|nr:hypothetical protein RHODOSMS8_01217 [Rhodobiaceae bacterium]